MLDVFRVDNQVAVIIGGAGGIGEALGNGLAAYGAKIVIADVTQERAEEVARRHQG
jgi:gluconate 5-dehydrogenase